MEGKMDAWMEIFYRLADAYSLRETSSLTYEKAEQLMGAVLYCIREAEKLRPDMPASGIGAEKELYEAGRQAVFEKAKEALAAYHALLPEFDAYGSQCLEDTFLKGLPAFFSRYDARFYPQADIITLDYPVLQDLTQYSGIVRISVFLECMEAEQAFLKAFPRPAVIEMLEHYDAGFRESADNLCEIVLTAFFGHVLAGKPFSEQKFCETDYDRIQKKFGKQGRQEIKRQVTEAVGGMVFRCRAESSVLSYLCGAAEDILSRMENAAACGSLNNLF